MGCLGLRNGEVLFLGRATEGERHGEYRRGDSGRWWDRGPGKHGEQQRWAWSTFYVDEKT